MRETWNMGRPFQRKLGWGGTLGVIALFAFCTRPAHAESIDGLIRGLDQPEGTEAVVSKLVAHGNKAVPALVKTARSDDAPTPRRGWAIVALARIGGADAERALREVYNSGSASTLVRTWAAAALVEHAASLDALVDLLPMLQVLPALGRPFELRVKALLGSTSVGSAASVERILILMTQQPQLASALLPAVQGAGPTPLVSVMTESKDMNARRQAAGVLATLGRSDAPGVARATLARYRFDAQATRPPWDGGPLYVPGIQWPRPEAIELIRSLIAWMVWCERNGRSAEHQQIVNNLRSVGLLGMAGINMPNWGDDQVLTWLRTLGTAIGRAELEKLLREQSALGDPRYQGLLKELR